MTFVHTAFPAGIDEEETQGQNDGKIKEPGKVAKGIVKEQIEYHGHTDQHHPHAAPEEQTAGNLLSAGLS